MSLGVKSVWRAHRSCSSIHELSVIPREHLWARRLCPRSLTTHRRAFADAASPKTVSNFVPSLSEKNDQKPSDTPENNELLRTRRWPGLYATRRPTHAQTANSALVKPAARFPSRVETKRSLRKHNASLSTQDFFEFRRVVAGTREVTWSDTLAFLNRHTPTPGKVAYFTVDVDEVSAKEARERLTELDTNLWQIRQRTQCNIGITATKDGSFGLALSGAENSVGQALLEVVRIAGVVSTVRVLDEASKELATKLLPEIKKHSSAIRLLEAGNVSSGGNTLTLQKDLRDSKAKSKLFTLDERDRYTLTKRADEITPPAEWTKASFYNHIFLLVHGSIPPHLHKTLYGNESHQQVVADLLVDAFISEETAAVVSSLALKMALAFFQSKGHSFRAQAREIFLTSETRNISIDIEVFHYFLDGAARVGDLAGFYETLKMMVRKGHKPNSHTWSAFMELTHDSKAKQQVLSKMGRRFLDPELRLEEARHQLQMDFDELIRRNQPIRNFLKLYDDEFQSKWLNTPTLNKMLATLGRYGRWEGCNILLQIVEDRPKAKPDVVTLNTVLTHCREWDRALSMLRSIRERWPDIKPNVVTYLVLYQAAWRSSMPNLLSVIWRYACFTHAVHPKLQSRLHQLLTLEANLCGRPFLKPWADTVFGKEAIETLKDEQGFKASTIARYYGQQAETSELSHGLEDKLDEALRLDRQIHASIKKGQDITPEFINDMTIELPTRKLEAPKAMKAIPPGTPPGLDLAVHPEGHRAVLEGEDTIAEQESWDRARPKAD